MDAGKTFAEGARWWLGAISKDYKHSISIITTRRSFSREGLAWSSWFLWDMSSLVPLMVQIGLTQGKYLVGGSLLTIRLIV